MLKYNNSDSADLSQRARVWVKIYIISLFTFTAVLTGSVASVILVLIEQYNVKVAHTTFLPLSRYAVGILIGIFISPYIGKFGYKKSIFLGLTGTILSCILMILIPGLIISVVFFIMLGVDYAVIKTSLFSMIKLVIKDKIKYISFVSLMECFNTFGILAGFWLFSIAIKLGSWLLAYYVSIAISLGFIIAILVIKIPELKKEEIESTENESVLKIFVLYKKPIIILFSISLIIYVMLEKGIADWLPVYNYLVYNIDMPLSMQIASIFGTSIGVGRLFFSIMIRYVNDNLLLIVLTALALISITALSFNDNIVPADKITHLINVPYVAYFLPLIGFFIAPVAPVVYSTILLFFPKKEQSRISGIIIIVSGIGSIAGSTTMVFLLNYYKKTRVLEFLAVLLTGLLISLILYIFSQKKENLANTDRTSE